MIIMASVTLAITESGNDSYQTGAVPGSGTPNLTSTICNANATTHFGLHHFITSATDIQQGATIDNAYFEVYYTSGSFDDPDFTIHCENVDASNAPTSGTDDVSNRTRTTGTLWNASGLGIGYEQSPDIKAEVQAVVNRTGWTKLGSLSVITVGKATGNARWSQYDGGNPPRLIINYTNPSSGGSLPPMRRTRTYVRL